MKLLLVEDIYLQGDWLKTQLESRLHGEVLWIQSGSEFRSRLDEIGAWAPDLALVDVMLKWSDPRPNLEMPPPGWSRAGAGLDCQKLLAARQDTRHTQVIIYTILSRDDFAGNQLPAGISHIQKDSDLGPLFQRIRELTANRARAFHPGVEPLP